MGARIFMRSVYKLSIVFSLLVFSLIAIACGGGSSDPGGANVPAAVKMIWERASSRTPIAQNVKQTTAKGVTIYSRAGLSPAHLEQADEALTELFADVAALFPGQADATSVNFRAYDIYEPDHDCIPSPVAKVPAFYVKDSSLAYDESQYDQYPGAGRSVVMAPERVFGLTTAGSTAWGGPPRAMMIVCPDLGHWRNAIRYGGEHNVAESAGNVGQGSLFALAAANRVHTQGGHPFIPSRAQSLVSPPKADWGEFAPAIWGE